MIIAIHFCNSPDSYVSLGCSEYEVVSNWSLYYFNLIKPNTDKWKYSERYDCNSKLRNLNTAGNYRSTFVCIRLPPLGAWLILRDVDKLEQSLCMGLYSHPWLYSAYGLKNCPYGQNNSLVCSKKCRFDEERKGIALHFPTNSKGVHVANWNRKE